MSTKKKKKEIKVNKGGRPTEFSEPMVKKLEAVFKLGASDETACRYAGISKQTLYNWYQKQEGFIDQINSAKEFARIAAGQVVVNAIVNDKDVNTAKWWLEKKYPKEFPSGGGVAVGIQSDREINVKIVDYGSGEPISSNGEYTNGESK